MYVSVAVCAFMYEFYASFALTVIFDKLTVVRKEISLDFRTNFTTSNFSREISCLTPFLRNHLSWKNDYCAMSLI